MSKHIVSCSFGKDSVATVILAREYGGAILLGRSVDKHI